MKKIPPVADFTADPVAEICADFTFAWVGSGPIAPIIEKHKLKVGDKLYARSCLKDIDDMEYARAMDSCRLQGRLEAFAMAMTECSPSFQRDTPDVRVAIDILHLDTLRQIKELKNGS